MGILQVLRLKFLKVQDFGNFKLSPLVVLNSYILVTFFKISVQKYYEITLNKHIFFGIMSRGPKTKWDILEFYVPNCAKCSLSRTLKVYSCEYFNQTLTTAVIEIGLAMNWSK